MGSGTEDTSSIHLHEPELFLFVFKVCGGGVEAVSGLGVLGSQGFSTCLLLTPVIKCEVFYGSNVNRLRLWVNYLIHLMFFMSILSVPSPSVKLFHLPCMTFFPDMLRDPFRVQ